MDIDEVKREAIELQQVILYKVQNFEKVTGTRVTDITLRRQEVTNMEDVSPRFKTIDCRVEVNLWP